MPLTGTEGTENNLLQFVITVVVYCTTLLFLYSVTTNLALWGYLQVIAERLYL